MKSGSHPTPIRTNRALARAIGVSEAAVRKARREGRLSNPGPDGWEVTRVRQEWKANTLTHVGGKRRTRGRDPERREQVRSPVSAEAVAAGEKEARRLLGMPGADVLSFADARRARELVKLAREALELRRMNADTFSRHELQACTFKLWRGVRDRLDGAVNREAPLLAARLGVEEGKMWRELRAFMRAVETDIAERGALRLLVDARDAGDEGEVCGAV